MKEAVAFIAKASKKVLVLLLSMFLFCMKKQILQCKSANSSVARFSQYPTQSMQKKATDGAWAQVTYTNAQAELVRRVASD